MSNQPRWLRTSNLGRALANERRLRACNFIRALAEHRLPRERNVSRALFLASSIVAVVLALDATCRADDKADITAIWNDPQFQKQFIGAYGINADVEPRV